MKQEPQIKCPQCSSSSIVRAGLKKLKRETIQRYKCSSCKKHFSSKQLKNKSYSPKIILNSISLHNIGYTLEETKALLAKRFKVNVPLTTIHSWTDEYKSICTFSRLRNEAFKQYDYTPENIIHKQTLNHIQPYTFKYHKAKLNMLIKENPKFTLIKDYINKISSGKFPHHIFTYNKNNNKLNSNANEQRASQLKFNYNKIKIISKTNQSNELAKLALNLAKSNNDRHSAIQDFMLINDSTTIAVEMPVYLTNWHFKYAWFDENNYFEFFPLHVVYEKR